MATYFVQSSTVGVDLNNTGTTQLFALGTHVLGTADSEWVYVQAATAVTLGKCVVINSAGTCAMASATDMVQGTIQLLGFAQVAFAASDFGWIPIRGGAGNAMAVLTTGSTSATSQVCVAGSGASTGMVSTVATASGSVMGVLFVSIAQTATATLSGAVLTWPRAANTTVGP